MMETALDRDLNSNLNHIARDVPPYGRGAFVDEGNRFVIAQLWSIGEQSYLTVQGGRIRPLTNV